mmetsp:Transcript_36356/g.67166  ORF Transcript_36356/g.67166 Transcript_36356/m.67166 type:complete len:184 (-) Transcript_36356:617-1168(-)
MFKEDLLTITTTSEIEIDADRRTVWDKIHDVKNFPETFSGVLAADVAAGGNPRKVGHRRRITRVTPQNHRVSATWYMVEYYDETKYDDYGNEMMSTQFYSEDFAGSGRKATASTTWTVTPAATAEDKSGRGCIVTISMVIVPRQFFYVVGKLAFAPLMKKIVRKGVETDLKDLAAACIKASKA